MAYQIVDKCVNCTACELVCPNDAISAEVDHFSIDPLLCTECAEVFAEAQCASICPIEGAILDELDEAVNPPGSLTGIIPLVAA